jgi:PAS domain S-box-containing protein
MATPLHVLILEDRSEDAELALYELRRSGFAPVWQRVETEADYLAALDPALDLILADYALPQFDALRALELRRTRGLDIPFIIVSGAIGEEVAVAAMRQGAADYLLKDRLTRLGAAVEHALEQHQLRIEMHKAEQSLRESEVRLASVIDSAMDAIISVDSTQRIVLFNLAAEQVFQCKASEAIGQPIERFIPERYRNIHQIHMARFGQTGVTNRVMGHYDFITGLRWNGTEFPIEASISHAQAGEQQLYTVIMRDITARKQTEAALHESERFARATVDALAEEIAILDETGMIIAVNHAWRAFAIANIPPDMSAKVAEGVNYLAVCDHARGANAQEAAAIAQGIRAVMSGEQEEFSLEYPCPSPNEQRWFHVHVTRFPGDGPLRVVVSHENITVRKLVELALLEERSLLEQRVAERTAELSAANNELTRAARLKDEFLASMSHELRTPLTAVLGITEILQEGVYGSLNERQRISLHQIEESGHHLLDLINDILDVAKIGAGKLMLEFDVIEIESLCQSSLRLVREAALKKHLTIVSMIDPAITFLYVDARRLKQILVNLLSNAVKFTPLGGEIGLEVVGDSQRQAVDLTVWDTGIGIAQEDLGRLFQPFVQLDSRLARQYNGTGLGLMLVYRMAELHGGSVSVTSEVGRGSRFTVSMPWQGSLMPITVRDVQSAPIAIEPSPAQILPSILIAEDNETNLTTITDYLVAKGYRVVVARNGIEAVAQVQSNQPALILMDIQMPEMDGLEAIQIIRRQYTLPYIPIIALTALAMPEDRERCLAAGADEYLSKPVSLKELVATINEQLRKANDIA